MEQTQIRYSSGLLEIELYNSGNGRVLTGKQRLILIKIRFYYFRTLSI